MSGYCGSKVRGWVNSQLQSVHYASTFLRYLRRVLKARLHGSPRLINTIESMKLNSTVERYCLHGSTKVNEAVYFEMAANELVREGVVVIYLIFSFTSS